MPGFRSLQGNAANTERAEGTGQPAALPQSTRQGARAALRVREVTVGVPALQPGVICCLQQALTGRLRSSFWILKTWDTDAQEAFRVSRGEGHPSASWSSHSSCFNSKEQQGGSSEPRSPAARAPCLPLSPSPAEGRRAAGVAAGLPQTSASASRVRAWRSDPPQKDGLGTQEGKQRLLHFLLVWQANRVCETTVAPGHTRAPSRPHCF